MVKFDLHVHSTASDGVFSVKDIIDKAFQLRLGGIALTDHDTVDGLKEAAEYAKEREMTFIPGIEFSVQWEEKEIHILGYFIDYTYPRLIEVTRELAEHRRGRALAIVDRLAELGMPLDREEFVKMGETGCVGRAHIARALVREGYVKSNDAAFSKWLDPSKPAYVKRKKVSIAEAITLIHEAGGIAVWAHPGAADTDGALAELLACGIDGMEVYHPKHDYNARRKYSAIAASHRLLQTGGSDFHTSGLGDHYVENEIVQEMIKRLPVRI